MKSPLLYVAVKKLMLLCVLGFSCCTVLAQQEKVHVGNIFVKEIVNNNFTINASATLFTKIAGTATFGIGYSRSVLEHSSELIRSGMILSYLNGPSDSFSDLAASANGCRNLSGVSLNNCITALDATIQRRINVNRIHVANAQATLSSSNWFGDDVTWGLHSSIDLNNQNNPVSDVYRWANAGATVQVNNWLVPELTVGYTKNLASAELSYYSVGITFLKRAELGLGWRDESINGDKNRVARSAFFSLAYQTKF